MVMAKKQQEENHHNLNQRNGKSIKSDNNCPNWFNGVQ
jgi:hypothetical protein